MKNFIDLIQYCPQCGHKYSETDIDRTGTFKCSNCKFRNYVKSFPTVCAIIPNDKGEILMVERTFDPGKGEFDPPGGYVNYGESPEEAIKRELKEELGVDIVVDKVINVGKTEYVQNEINYPTVLTCFLTKPINSAEIKLNADENSSYKYFSIEEILQGKINILWKPVLEAIKIYRKEHS